MKRTLIITGQAARLAIYKAVKEAPDGWVVTIAPPTRNLEQNAKLWAMLADLAQQTDWHGVKLVSEEWKDLLSAGLVQSKVVPNREGSGFVILGQRTSKLSTRQFADLIELVYAVGAERNVRWSEPGLYREAA